MSDILQNMTSGFRGEVLEDLAIFDPFEPAPRGQTLFKYKF